MNTARLDHLRESVCERKTPLGRSAAMDLAARVRAGGTTMSAYRCPFVRDDYEPHDDGAPHWHVGHPPRMDTLETLAEYLRERHSGTPAVQTADGLAR